MYDLYCVSDAQPRTLTETHYFFCLNNRKIWSYGGGVTSWRWPRRREPINIYYNDIFMVVIILWHLGLT